jgi:predicted MFS family arabinose efflux permease
LAGALAPLLGGLSMIVAGWAGVYWFRVPLTLLALACLPWLRDRLGRQALRVDACVDLPGSALLVACLCSLLLVPAILGSWTGALPAALLTLAGTVLALAYRRRVRARGPALLPAHLSRDPGFLSLNAGNVVVQSSSFAVPLMVPYYLVSVVGWGPLAGGFLLALWAVGTMLGSAMAASCVRRWGDEAASAVGATLAAAGLWSIAAWAPIEMSWPWMIPCLILQGAGLGLYQVTYTDRIVAALPASQRGVAGSLSMVTRTIGVILGASMLTWILQARQAMATVDEGPRLIFAEGFMVVFLAAGGVIAALLLARLIRRMSCR